MRKSTQRLFLGIVLSAVILGFAVQPARAQDTACPPESTASGSVTVNRLDAEITILPNGDIQYVETWNVDFIGGPYRFAFQEIPLNRATGFTDWSVSENGVIYTESSRGENVFNVESDFNSSRITWCFPPANNQVRTFTLRYTVQGSLGIYEDGDRYFWGFIEGDRGYSIMRSSVRVNLPAGFPAEELALAGYINGVENLQILDSSGSSGDFGRDSAARIVDADTIEFTGGPFYSGDVWEIGVIFPHGVVTAAPQNWQVLSDNAPLLGVLAMGAAVLLLLGGALGVYLVWYLLGRDKPVGVRPEYIPRPPEDLPPGLAGVLLDERADMQDIMATLVDLARRGYLTITELDAPEIGESTDFLFRRSQADRSALLPYEKSLLDAVFGHSAERKLSALKNKFYAKLADIKARMYKEVTARQYFPADPENVRFRYGCTGFLLAMLTAFLGLSMFGLFSQYTPLIVFTAASLSAFPVGLLLIAAHMPRKSQTGARAAAQWRAFRNYLANVEKYTKLDSAREQFEQFLPYAIAFGLEKTWLERFAPEETLLPAWYVPYYPVHRPSGSAGDASPGGGAPSLDSAAQGMFGGLQSMSTGFFTLLDNAASTFTSAPQSSGGSGFSGGGFSGGGGSSGFG
jgi:uncharacterized membrane protein YgcG